MFDSQNVWEQVKQDLVKDIEADSYKQIIDDIVSVYKTDDQYIYITVKSHLAKYRIEHYYINNFNNSLHKIVPELNFKLLLESDTKTETSQPEKPNNDALLAIKKRNLRQDYTFDKFVTGEANKEAFTFASKIASMKKVTINPFYIFGDVGLGKTHLMTAIGHKMLNDNPELNLIFTTAQQFIEDFIKTKNKTQKDFDIIDEFDNYYRNADVLLIDDIQYFENAKASQDEFFKLFEFLFENQKQIIVTSDRPATELNIMDRLKTRFAWGIQTDLKKPNLSLRCDILRQKLVDLIDNPTDVPQDVIEYIAKNFDKNVRELEGAIRRYISYCVSFDFPFDLDSAIQSLKSILPKDHEDVQDDIEQYVIEVKEAVAKYFNISIKDLVSQTRKKQLVYARDITVYLLKDKFNLTLDGIGKFLGNRDHSTIAHSYNKIATAINIDENIQEDYKNLLSNLKRIN